MEKLSGRYLPLFVLAVLLCYFQLTAADDRPLISIVKNFDNRYEKVLNDAKKYDPKAEGLELHNTTCELVLRNTKEQLYKDIEKLETEPRNHQEEPHRITAVQAKTVTIPFVMNLETALCNLREEAEEWKFFKDTLNQLDSYGRSSENVMKDVIKKLEKDHKDYIPKVEKFQETALANFKAQKEADKAIKETRRYG